MKYLLFSILFLLIYSCHTQIKETKQEILNPAMQGAQCPRLFKDQDGQVCLSWVETLADTSYELAMAQYNDTSQTFENKKIVAKGENWFVNWADMPGIYPFRNGRFFVYWLQMSSSGTYDYDIMCKVGSDKEGWSEPFVLHNDGINAEHGFVSVVSFDSILLVSWLDGRFSKSELGVKDDHGHGHGGAMTVRSAQIDSYGNISNRQEIDHRVCDCCQTDLANIPNGALLVYRDRSDKDIRDIYYSRYGADHQWTEPRSLVNDFWQIYGCPVNGPAVASKDSIVAVALYGEVQGHPMTRLIWSLDQGITFAPPLTIGTMSNLGRVDVEILDQTHIVVSSMIETDLSGKINLSIINPQNRVIENIHLADNSPKRLSGFPKILQKDGRIFSAYTDATGENSIIKTHIISDILMQ